MKNGQLKPGYNIQTGTENQFITGFTLHQRATDTTCLIPHIEELKRHGRNVPDVIIADAGYGSEENYTYLAEQNIEAFVKYHTFDQEQKRSFAKQVGRVENMTYDEELDEFICQQGKRLIFQREKVRKTETGYESVKREYTCQECEGCPFQQVCAKGKEKKTIQLSIKNVQQRKEIREKLLSEEGRQVYTKRMAEIESVYGQIKHNRGFRRFLLRGLSKITVEWGLICVAHNLLKKAVMDQNRSITA